MGARASTLEELGAIQGKVHLAEEAGRWTGFRPRPTDVIISPFAKCGTTWLQQIFHTLRTRGDEDYDDVSRVVPWIETAAMLGVDLDAEQKANPRGFKSHLGWDAVPKGCRYIVALRDPLDVVVSMYRFMEGWYIEPRTIPLDQFARAAFLPGQRADRRRGNYWQHLMSWWSARHEKDVLLLSYEGMHRDPASTIRRVAAHSGIELDDDLLELSLARSSLEYMLAHKDRFDDLMMRELTHQRGGLPLDVDAAKVRLGKVGSHRDELSDELIADVNVVWTQRVTPKLGFPDYPALERALAAGE